MVVGVNGVGKTTTIGKLAYQFKKAGKSVYLGAADTFRAAAVGAIGDMGRESGCSGQLNKRWGRSGFCCV